MRCACSLTGLDCQPDIDDAMILLIMHYAELQLLLASSAKGSLGHNFTVRLLLRLR